ncbi:alpha/beta fold hydrolase [Halococcus saccharolyticus]|uniref:Alpha/beta hydrolase fold protein n=1 Tax=Halococcus saccharolyticus DSM 5350 TaxID=1227455 RepID=M0MJG6_9EURY|nr:alpha/beta hydrolase [Halococcus saccharolyticus]EMA45821.1 alpha/beta hydrolase fold protein [Halococcus saccharolyticus DSM 5350]
MKLRAAVGALAGAGLVAVTNRALTGRAGVLDHALPGTQHTYRWRGFDIAYAEAGDPDDPDCLLLHGINAAGSSREFERVFEQLAAEYHVIAPDFPGFGRSDRPPLVYSASLYTTFVTEFACELTDDAVCVASSLSGAYAALAADDAGFAELVLVCPTAETMPERRVWFRSLLRSPFVGEALFNLLASKPSLRYFERDHAIADPSILTEEYIDYRWRTTHQPGARFAPASFVSGFLDPDIDLGDRLAALDIPTTIVWGRDADPPGLERGRELADTADARLVVFDDAKLLPHVERSAAFVDTLAETLPA